MSEAKRIIKFGITCYQKTSYGEKPVHYQGVFEAEANDDISARAIVTREHIQGKTCDICGNPFMYAPGQNPIAPEAPQSRTSSS